MLIMEQQQIVFFGGGLNETLGNWYFLFHINMAVKFIYTG